MTDESSDPVQSAEEHIGMLDGCMYQSPVMPSRNCGLLSVHPSACSQYSLSDHTFGCGDEIVLVLFDRGGKVEMGDGSGVAVAS